MSNLENSANNVNSVNSVLTLKNLYFEKINFERDIDLPSEIKTRFETEYKENGNEIEVKLICSVKTDTKVSLNVSLVGIFENGEQNEELREEINKINTVSIMFPYLRSELSLITAQPNFPTIDLPVFNINELLKANGEIVGRINK